MTGHPADIGGTPVDIIILHIKNPLTGVHDIGQIATGGMDNTFRLAGRARGIKDKEDIFGIHGFRCAVTGDISSSHFLVPPGITTVGHLNVITGPSDHNYIFHSGTLFQGQISIWFQGNGLAGAQHGISCDQYLGLTILNPAFKSHRRETGKDHGMGRANTGTG